MRYIINLKYQLLIGGGSMDERPLYIRLINKKNNIYIDIRYENVSDFIEDNKGS